MAINFRVSRHSLVRAAEHWLVQSRGTEGVEESAGHIESFQTFEVHFTATLELTGQGILKFSTSERRIGLCCAEQAPFAPTLPLQTHATLASQCTHHGSDFESIS